MHPFTAKWSAIDFGAKIAPHYKACYRKKEQWNTLAVVEKIDVFDWEEFLRTNVVGGPFALVQMPDASVHTAMGQKLHNATRRFTRRPKSSGIGIPLLLLKKSPSLIGKSFSEPMLLLNHQSCQRTSCQSTGFLDVVNDRLQCFFFRLEPYSFVLSCENVLLGLSMKVLTVTSKVNIQHSKDSPQGPRDSRPTYPCPRHYCVVLFRVASHPASRIPHHVGSLVLYCVASVALPCLTKYLTLPAFPYFTLPCLTLPCGRLSRGPERLGGLGEALTRAAPLGPGPQFGVHAHRVESWAV